MTSPAVALTTEYVLTLTAVAAIGEVPDRDMPEADAMAHIAAHTQDQKLVTFTIRSSDVFVLDDPLLHLDCKQVLDCFAGAVSRATALASTGQL